MDQPARPPLSNPPPDAALRLRSAWERGRLFHLGLELSEHSFVARALDAFRRRFEQSGNALAEDLAAAIEIFPAEDFYLATACETNLPGAWDRFTQEYASRLAPPLRKLWSGCDAQALALDLCADMALPPQDGRTRTKLGAFQGLGSLFNWLLVSARRQVIATKKQLARDPPPLPESEGPRAHDPGPFELAADSEDAGRIQAIIAEVWKTLTSKESLGITLKYASEMNQRAIARVLDVSESRVSRILGAAFTKLHDGVNRALGAARSQDAPGAGVLKLLAADLEALLTINSAFVLDLKRRGPDS
jgi:RNA polymerase sigma factor (sigma-70 family)